MTLVSALFGSFATCECGCTWLMNYLYIYIYIFTLVEALGE